MTHALNQRVIINLPEAIGKFTAGKRGHVLAGKTIRDLINSLKQMFPAASELLESCNFIRDGKKLLLDNEVYDDDIIYLQEIKRKKNG